MAQQTNQQTASSTKSIKQVKPTRVPRIDGPLKVSGQARYTSDMNMDRMLYAVPVCATIGKGKITKLDDSVAKKMKGVVAVYSHGSIGQLYRPTAEKGFEFRIDEARPPFEDEKIYYYGQYVAVVVAETFELAQAAARSVKVSYSAEKPNVSQDFKQEDLKKTDAERGKAADVFASAKYKVDYTYVTPGETHNPIELHATVAHWEGEGDKAQVTIYETSQAIATHRNVMAQILGIPKENVRVITKFLGSGFGGKLWPWSHSPLAAQTARLLKRPVKLVVDRHMAFTNCGHRPRTQQHMKLSADAEGNFTSLSHEYATQSAMFGDYKENCGEVTGFLYKCPNVMVTSGVARRNQAVPTSMRGPGAVPGLFALESVIDELAIELGMDPVALRIKNDIQEDQLKKLPFSSRYLKECLELGAEKFGWAKRSAKTGSMKSGDEILGWGVAACTWQANKVPAEVSFEFTNQGRIRIKSGTHDIGTGMYTAIAQIVSENAEVGLELIDVEIGDTDLPPGALAGGSMATGSMIPALLMAFKKAKENLISGAVGTPTSPFYGQKAEALNYVKGKVTGPKGGSVAFGDLVKKMNMSSVAAKGIEPGSAGADPKKAKFSNKSFGAHFVEVGWQPELARLRVKRVVTVIDAGRIINFQPARNQIEGAIVMGIGMAMFEKNELDPRDGDVINKNLADYVMSVHADCPEIDVSFLDYPDKEFNEMGARGVGEIGLAGIAAAITGAVYHATGVRVRELPVTIEKLLV